MTLVGVGLLSISWTGLAGCASGNQGKAPVSQASQSDASSRHKANIESRQDNLGDAVTAPLEDLNLRRIEIPDILIQAEKDPYSLKGLDNCRAIANEVRRLDEVLGDDFDEPPPPPDSRTNTQKGTDAAGKAGLGAVRGATEHLLPFRGIFRKLTGAEAHDKDVQRAIKAGNDRRAFLKGIGMNRNCAPPAAPSWFVPRSKPPKRRY